MVSQYGGQHSSPVSPSSQDHSVLRGPPLTTNNAASVWSSRQINLRHPVPAYNLRPDTALITLFPRSGFALSTTTTGDFYIFGGDACGGAEKNDIYHYSISTNSATLLKCSGDIPSPRFKPGSTIFGDTQLFIFGGLTTGQGEWNYDDGLYCLDISGNSFDRGTVSHRWTRIPALGETPVGRSAHAVASNSTTLFIFGGYDGRNWLNDLWALDLCTVSDTGRAVWKLLEMNPGPSAQIRPTPRSGAVVVPYQDHLIMFGGEGGGRRIDTWSFDLNDWKWVELKTTGNIPPPCCFHAAAIVNDIIYVFGGFNVWSSDELYAFEIPTQQWVRPEYKGLKPSKRNNHSMVAVGTKIYLFGGETQSRADDESDTAYILDTVNIPSLFAPRTPDKAREVDMAPYTHDALLSEIVGSPRKTALAAGLQGSDAQHMVNFLTRVLEPGSIISRSGTERKRVLHLLSKIAKSAQIFPRSIELSGVQCSLANPINDSGAFGSIYQGLFKGQLVCVKAVRMTQAGASEKVLRAHAGELVFGAYVSHTNVLPFYGAYLSYEAKVTRICIVSPWMEGGSLDEYLQEFPTMPRIPLLLDVITGLTHLHELDIIHSDLKASNVLVSDVGRARLADFGVSTIALTNIGSTTAKDFSGTTNWMAPERFMEDDIPTRASDMWAFGCVCLEVMTGDVPFSRYKPLQLISAFIKGKKPSPRSFRDIPDKTVSAVANNCWDYDPKKRPTAQKVRETLANLRIKDNRPEPVDAVSAALITTQRARSYSKVDYDIVLPILRRIVDEGNYSESRAKTKVEII